MANKTPEWERVEKIDEPGRYFLEDYPNRGRRSYDDWCYPGHLVSEPSFIHYEILDLLKTQFPDIEVYKTALPRPREGIHLVDLKRLPNWNFRSPTLLRWNGKLYEFVGGGIESGQTSVHGFLLLDYNIYRFKKGELVITKSHRDGSFAFRINEEGLFKNQSYLKRWKATIEFKGEENPGELILGMVGAFNSYLADHPQVPLWRRIVT